MMYFLGTMLAELVDPLVFLICCGLSYLTRSRNFFFRLIVIVCITVSISQFTKVLVGETWTSTFYEAATAKLIVVLVCLLIFRRKVEHDGEK
jgi:hypothetical protein